ncbi:MAG TPA: ParA family protein [Gaiellaceae bacterium]|nr:ParA family protein [Gaiellaceae bacterium]
MRIAVANIKGGVGKTTAAVYLAAAAAESGDGTVLLIDADRQGSSAEWLEERPLEGVTVVEAPSERTLSKALGRRNGVVIIDTPPGDHRLLEAATASAHAVVVPTRAGGVELSPALHTVELVSGSKPRGVVISSARLGTNDLDDTIEWWRDQKVPVWGVIPERVGIASGPEARLSREGLDLYADVLDRVRAKKR